MFISSPLFERLTSKGADTANVSARRLYNVRRFILNTATDNLVRVGKLLDEAITAISEGEDFESEFVLDYPYDLLRDLGAAVELARLIADKIVSFLEVEKFLDDMDRDINQTGVVTWTSDDVQVLEALKALVYAVEPMAYALDQEEQTLYGIVNPTSYEGETILTMNDRGSYEDPWAALADLAEAKREFENPQLYFVSLMSFEKIQRMQYGASRLCLAISAITKGEMGPRAIEEWAYDTLCEALGWSKPAGQPAWAEAIRDHTDMLTANSANSPDLRDVTAQAIEKALSGIEVNGVTLYDLMADGDVFCLDVASDALWAAGVE